MENSNSKISWGTLWRILIFLGILLLLWVAKEALGVLFIAIVLSLVIDPAISWLEKKKVHRILGTLITFFLIIVIFSATMFFIVPIIAGQMQSFLIQINDIAINFFGIGVPEKVIEGVSSNLNQILGYIQASNISITGTISTVLRNLIFVAATLIITFYLSVEKRGPERMIKMVLPQAYETPILKVFKKFKDKIKFWAIAQLGLSIAVGVVATAGLLLLGVKYALVLGLLAAVFELVPYIGPILTGAVAFLIATTTGSFTLGIYVVILFVIINQLENNILIPIIYKKSMKIHPVIILVAFLAGGQAAGFVGVLLAVPIALLVQETLNYLAEQKAFEAGEKLNI